MAICGEQGDFLVHEDDGNRQDRAKIIQLSDGTLLVVWLYASLGPFDRDVYARSFAPDGEPLGEMFTVHPEVSGLQSFPEVAETTDGFLVTYLTGGNCVGVAYTRSADPNSSTGWDICGDPFVINENSLGGSSYHFVTTLADGGQLAVWIASGKIYARHLDLNTWATDDEGNKTSPILANAEFEVASGVSSVDVPTVSALSAGGYVIAWSTPSGQVQARFFDDMGLGSEIFEVSEGGGPSLPSPLVSVVELSDGSVLFVWSAASSEPDLGEEVFASRYDSMGAIGEVFVLNALGEGDQRNPDADVLEDGRLIAVWSSTNGPAGSAGGIFGRFLAPDTGEPVGEEFRISAPTGDRVGQATDRPDVTALQNGGFTVAWQSGNSFDTDVLVQVFDRDGNAGTTIEGTALSDNPLYGNAALTGGLATDRISGLAGSDLIYGNGGADVIRGGEHNDTLYGDDADFFVRGTADCFIFSNEAGDDIVRDFEYLQDDDGNAIGAIDHLIFDRHYVQELKFTLLNSDGVVENPDDASQTLISVYTRPKNDDGSLIVDLNDLLGGLRWSVIVEGVVWEGLEDVPEGSILGGQKIYGNATDESLKGGDYGDDLRGAGGNDILIGGAGEDRLIGQGGDDEIYGGDDDDLLMGRRGNDWLEGGAGEDTVNGGGGDDTLLGGEDNDILKSLGGLDRLDGGTGNDTLIGGKRGGNAVFRFVDDFGADEINNFDPLRDQLYFSTVAFGSAADVRDSIFVENEDLKIEDGAGNSVSLISLGGLDVDALNIEVGPDPSAWGTLFDSLL